MNRNKQYHREKEAYNVQVQLHDYYSRSRNVTWIPYDKPIKDGWYVKLRLTKQAANRMDSDKLQTAINMCHPKSFVIKDKKDHRRSLKNPKKKDRVQASWGSYNNRAVVGSLYGIHAHIYDELDDEELKSWFIYQEASGHYWWSKDHYICTVPEYYYEIVYKRRYVTHYAEHDEIIEQELAEIYNRYNQLRHLGAFKNYSYKPNKDERQIEKGRRRASERVVSRKLLTGYDAEFPAHKNGWI